MVGIFCKPYKDFAGAWHDAHIRPVDGAGNDLMVGNFSMSLAPLTLEGLVPVLERDDIPPARIRHMPANWQPQP